MAQLGLTASGRPATQAHKQRFGSPPATPLDFGVRFLSPLSSSVGYIASVKQLSSVTLPLVQSQFRSFGCQQSLLATSARCRGRPRPFGLTVNGLARGLGSSLPLTGPYTPFVSPGHQGAMRQPETRSPKSYLRDSPRGSSRAHYQRIGLRPRGAANSHLAPAGLD